MDQNELINKITREVMNKLQTQMNFSNRPASSGGSGSGIVVNSPADAAQLIDHTLLKPEATKEQFDKLVEEAKQYRFWSVCVNSNWVSYVAPKLRGSGVKVCAVVGFPLGAMDARSMAFETRRAIEDGAAEIDMVLNIGALKSGDLKTVEEGIRAVRRATRQKTVLKVILETGLLEESEKIIACQLCKKAGADFVKTSTGFAKGGATVEDIALMRRTVGPEMGVKASGGVRTFADVQAMVAAGATRVGASSSVAIVTGGAGTGGY